MDCIIYNPVCGFCADHQRSAGQCCYSVFTASVLEDVMLMEKQTVNVDATEDVGVAVATIDNNVNTIQSMNEVLPHQVLKKGDKYDDGVVFYASADEIITMTVRDDGVKSFENHMVG